MYVDVNSCVLSISFEVFLFQRLFLGCLRRQIPQILNGFEVINAKVDSDQFFLYLLKVDVNS